MGSKPGILLAAVGAAAITLLAAPRPAEAAAASVCKFEHGPRAGQTAPHEGALGAPCDDGAGSIGVIVQADPPRPSKAQPYSGVMAGIVLNCLLFCSRHDDQGPSGLGTRLFTPPDFDLPSGYGAVAVIAFRRAPADDSQRQRYLRFCSAFVTVLPDSAVAAAEAPERAQMVTLWPREDLRKPLSVKAPANPAALSTLCSAAVDNYAYVAADSWLANLPRSVGFGDQRRGPFLVAWAPPKARGQPNAPILAFDLSDFEQPQTIQDAFGVWKAEIEQDPGLWSHGWQLTQWRLKTQAMADRYGGEIISAIKLLPATGGQ